MFCIANKFLAHQECALLKTSVRECNMACTDLPDLKAMCPHECAKCMGAAPPTTRKPTPRRTTRRTTRRPTRPPHKGTSID